MLCDTRWVHRHLFSQLITQGAALDYAGHYRGEALSCLRTYNVQVGRMKGTPADQVCHSMERLGRLIRKYVGELDASFQRQPGIARGDRLVAVTRVAAWMFATFLKVHPYANGNGHIGRIMLAALMHRYGFPLRSFPIEPGPKEDAYYEALIAYQNRPCDPGPLERYLLRHFALPPSTGPAPP
ncbi:MAG: Fic family protein [Candidatus Eremiobacterota bacterium]